MHFETYLILKIFSVGEIYFRYIWTDICFSSVPPQKKSCSLQFPLIMPRKFARTEKSDFSVTQNVFCEGVTLCNSIDTFPMECLVIRTGWRRCIECLKLQVIFHRWVTNDRALLQKMTYKDEASYGSSPPCSGWLDTFPSHISTLLRNSVAIVIHTSHSGWLDTPSPKCRWSYRMAKTHRIPYLYRSFSAKVTYI